MPWPSGKARVCKTLIPRFKSGRHLKKSDGDHTLCAPILEARHHLIVVCGRRSLAILD